jgi:hypothetical protein
MDSKPLRGWCVHILPWYSGTIKIDIAIAVNVTVRVIGELVEIGEDNIVYDEEGA